MTRRSLVLVFVTTLIALGALIGWPVASFAWQSGDGALLASVEPSYLQLLHWRMVGPSRGGRVTAVAGDPPTSWCFISAPPAAASGRPKTAASTGTTCRTDS